MLYYQFLENKSAKYCMVFIHGYAGSSEDWVNQVNYFTKHYQLLIPDLPGHGKSKTLAPSNLTVPVLAQSIDDLISELNIKLPIVIVGHSMASRIAIELCYLLGQNAVGLVLVDCGYKNIINPPSSFEEISAGIEYKTWINEFFKQTFASSTPNSICNAVMSNVEKFDQEIGKKLLPNVQSYDYYVLSKVLRLIKIKVLAIQSTIMYQGKRHVISEVPDVLSEWLILLEKNVDLLSIEIIPNCGHFIMLEQPRVFNDMLTDYISVL